MIINKLPQISVPFIGKVFLVLLLLFSFAYSGFSDVQPDSETAQSGLIPLTNEELDLVSHQGLIFADALWADFFYELNFLDADIYIKGVSYGNTLTINSPNGVKFYPLPTQIDRIVFNNIRFRDRSMSSESTDSTPPMGSVIVDNINFEKLDVVVTLD